VTGTKPLQVQFASQRRAFLGDPCPDVRVCRDRLDRLAVILDKNQENIVAAAAADFGHRARMETLFGEVLATGFAVDHARKHLDKWMRHRKVPTPLHMKPGHSYLVPQPLGVVGIIAPWNYPFYLALSPLVPALAAGNRVMMKPSEVTPRCSDLLAAMMAEVFDPDEVAVVTGGTEVGEAFAAVPFDHLLFTGSTAVGRRIALAAAANLTPVTLELGGKSPAIIDTDVDLVKAARSIMFGKAFNAGQTCVAPDYVLAPRAQLPAVIAALTEAAASLFPQMTDTPDYSAIISDRHFERLSAILAEARASGVALVELGEATQMQSARKIPITLAIDPPRDLRLMQDEIFGPILPIVSYDDVDDAIAYVNDGDRPLALYWFGRNGAVRDQVLARTVSGGVTINDTNWHVVQENLPFGGVGASGHGAYHGEAGFATFSHLKPVFEQSRFANTRIIQPPYTPRTEKILKLIQRFL
jgi:coniferyl-aldehyde dehydrogenase